MRFSKANASLTMTRRYNTFFAGRIDVLPFDQGAAQVAGELWAMLEASGKPIGAYDLLLAGRPCTICAHYRQRRKFPESKA